MKKIILYIVAVIAMVAASCSSDHFTIEGYIKDAGTQNVRIVYSTPEGIQSAWITLKDSRFTFTGASEELTVVYIFNQQRKMIAHVAAQNGDDIEVEGSFVEASKTKVTGTDINEQWSSFLCDHSGLIAMENHAKLDAEIEKFISENPDNVVSTLLLTNDYSSLTDAKKTKQLLAKISTDARPESIMKNFYVMQSSHNEQALGDHMQSLTLYSSRDSIETFSPYRSSYSLVYFWNPDDKFRYKDMKELKQFKKDLKSERLTVIDINLDSDTIRWKSIVRNDSADCLRYWAVGGIMNGSLQNLHLSNTPYYIVTDSTGARRYNGTSLPAARAAINKFLKL